MMASVRVADRRPGQQRRRLHRLGLWWTFAAGLVIAGATIVAIVQNGRHVEVRYLAWNVDVSLIVVVLTTAVVSVSLDELGGLVWRRRRRSRLGRDRELAQLRTEHALPNYSTPTAGPSGVRATGAAFVRSVGKGLRASKVEP